MFWLNLNHKALTFPNNSSLTDKFYVYVDEEFENIYNLDIVDAIFLKNLEVSKVLNT